MDPKRLCPRCGTGELMLDSDIYGRYANCLTCGYLRDLVDSPPNESDGGGGDEDGDKGLSRRRGPYRPRSREARP